MRNKNYYINLNDREYLAVLSSLMNKRNKLIQNGKYTDGIDEVIMKIKEVIGMLFIEQVYEKSNIKSDYVRCPSCKRGRLCDKPIGEKATVIALKSGHSERTSSRIILKCPKCSQKFIIHLSKEN